MLKSNLIKFFKRVKKIMPDANTKSFIKHNRLIWNKYKIRKSKNIILLDLYGIPETEIARSYFVNVLAKKTDSIIKTHSLKRSFNLSLKKVYESFNVKENIVCYLNDNQKKNAEHQYNKILEGVKSKKDLYELEFEGINIGVDIYETYLATYKEYTVNLDDPKFLKTLRLGIELAIFWGDYFKENNVKGVISSHSCYLSFNVVCSIAYKYKVPVYFPNPIYLNYSTKPYSIHHHFSHYRELFSQLDFDEQNKAIDWAKSRLDMRLNGEVGVDMRYSTKSAFTAFDDSKRLLPDNDKTKILICSHCFFDNPNAYGGMLFPDFYEWLCFIGEVTNETDYEWFIKVHPDPLPGTYEILNLILKKYNKIKILPHSVSHLQLAHEGINFVLTAYGTVGQEYPLLGIPVMNAGYNPRIAYDFNWHPSSKKEFREMLRGIEELDIDIKVNDIYEFYYMHHNYIYTDDLIFDSYKDYKDISDVNNKSMAYKTFLENWDKNKHEKIIGDMDEFILKGRSHHFTDKFMQ